MCVDLKRTVALSTLSNVAVLLFSLGCGLIDLAVLHLIVHAFFKSLLFIAVGFVLHSCFSSQDSRLPSCFSHVCVVLHLLPVCCLAAISFTAAYFSKDVLIDSFLSVSNSLLSLICFFIVVLLSICYSFRLLIHLLAIIQSCSRIRV